MDMNDFYKGKKILVTGYTGFKGAYLSHILYRMGADVFGYALAPQTEPSLHTILQQSNQVRGVLADIRDYNRLQEVFDTVQPEIVFHLAAQPLVRESYRNPRYTYETNVLGTVNVCECIRKSRTVKSFVNVTTDKVYLNEEQEVPFTEDMPLDGLDPYSNSKSCSELVTHSYVHSFLRAQEVAVSTVRAGNVIGGGDYATDRIIPDCVRAVSQGKTIVIRNPHSIRPYQHVLEPLYAYLLIAMQQYENPEKQGSYNVGPELDSCITTGEIADLFCKYWKGAEWLKQYDGGPYESGCLKLDCRKMRNVLGWRPRGSVEEAVKKTVEWYQAYSNGEDMIPITNQQIGEMFNV